MENKMFKALLLCCALIIFLPTLSVSAHPGRKDELGGHFRRADCVYLLHTPTALARSAKNKQELIALIRQNNTNSACVNQLSESKINLEGYVIPSNSSKPSKPVPKPATKPKTNPKKITSAPVTLQMGKKYPARLQKCVDGDTANFVINGKQYKTRFLYIDTPESTIEREAFGKEASNFTCNLLKKGNIALQPDGGNLYDKYGRLLAWVWVGNTLQQEAITKAGLVEDFYDYGTYKYEDRIQHAMNYAKQNYVGIYAANKPKTKESVVKKVIQKEETKEKEKAVNPKETKSNEKDETKKKVSKETVAPVKKEKNASEHASANAKKTEESSFSFWYLWVYLSILLLFFIPMLFRKFNIKPLFINRLVARKVIINVILGIIYLCLFFITVPLVWIELIRFVFLLTKKKTTLNY
ncbi:thermonuclease family protein [Fictibacillus enclensis]|uniref:thermonuclease family protein n=1 Tax=Fictibacillus enclensis TaxID=1017270 RepID=UPI0025A29504|nr:thermonuclease family protein [Fictibacillus enclensis]MDM5338493.1 thermonuclease family protein [Fictibacillus enclensis]